MKKTDVDYMLTMSNLICKLEKGEDCSSECGAVQKMEESKKEGIAGQLMDRIARCDGENAERFVQALREVGSLDADYIEDFAAVMQGKRGRESDAKELVEKVVARTVPYSKTMMEDIFWQNLTMLAVNCGDNDLLEQYICCIEKLRESAEE